MYKDRTQNYNPEIHEENTVSHTCRHISRKRQLEAGAALEICDWGVQGKGVWGTEVPQWGPGAKPR